MKWLISKLRQSQVTFYVASDFKTLLKVFTFQNFCLGTITFSVAKLSLSLITHAQTARLPSGIPAAVSNVGTSKLKPNQASRSRPLLSRSITRSRDRRVSSQKWSASRGSSWSKWNGYKLWAPNVLPKVFDKEPNCKYNGVIIKNFQYNEIK